MKIQFLFLFLFFSLFSFSQTKQEIIQQRVELISEQLESEDLDLTDVLQALNYFFDNPINLNNTTAEELKQLELLSDIQITDLLLHIKLHGKLISQYELQALKYWDLNTILTVLPFIKVDDRFEQVQLNFKEVLKYGKFESLFRFQRVLESKNGYENVPDSIKENSNSYYWGDPNRYYSRLRFSYRNNLSFGITAEKDPGEEFFKGTQSKGFDFYSFHFYYKGGKYLKSVSIGDYQLQIGQGLNLWSGYAFGKTADVTNIKKNAIGFKPYTSVDENRFLRGAAVELGYKKMSLILFASNKKVSGTTIQDSLVEDLEFVSSVDLSGFHRTNSEVKDKDIFTEQIAGLNLKYLGDQFNMGVATIYQGYNLNFQKNEQAYNQFDFRGKGFMSTSVDYSYIWKNVNFFGELSHASFSNGLAFLQGIIVALDHKSSLSLLYRNYAKNYQTFYNNGLAESGNTQNEKGMYLGFSHRPKSAWAFNTYLDVFRFPWLKYLVDAPTQGYEYLGQLTYKPNKVLEIYGRFRQQLRQKNSRNEFDVTPIEDVIQRNYRINFSYTVLEGVQLKTRLEYVTINRPSNTAEQGMIFTQDLLLKLKSSPFDIALRYALFDTDSYDSRVYTFETNALYVFSVPAYYYKGSRAYVTLRYSFLRRFDLWLRYGTFIYANTTAISSGAEQINGNTKSEIVVQLRATF
ncbi:MAG: hypothetical protein HYU67_11765 [Flavobacteriia bacterium]|nr:hypothetical protein [Flavobacteriia bacterium]